MNGSELYLLIGGIILVLVVVWLMARTVRQLKRRGEVAQDVRSQPPDVVDEPLPENDLTRVEFVVNSESESESVIDHDLRPDVESFEDTDISAGLTDRTSVLSWHEEALNEVAETTDEVVETPHELVDISDEANVEIAPKTVSDTVNPFVEQALRRHLSQRFVLGWLTVYVDGGVGISDQVYDETLVEKFSVLAQQSQQTAELVGMTGAEQFVIQGPEGSICITPVEKYFPGREDYLVVFIDAGVEVEHLWQALEGDV